MPTKKGEPRFKHGWSGKPPHRNWVHMLNRCIKPGTRGYENYGGRGIKVCERWLDFLNFLEDMGVPPKGYSLDRIDNNGNYEPGNCRWASKETQVRNARSNRNITFNGVTKCVAEWAREYGINKLTIRARILAGWPVEKLFIPPTKKGNPNPSCHWRDKAERMRP